MPEWKVPATRKRRMRGSMPAGVASPSGRDQHHVVADRDRELVRQRIAENDAVAAVGQILDAAALDALRQSDRAPLLLRQHAADAGAGGMRAVHQQRLLLRCTARPRARPRQSQRLLPGRAASPCSVPFMPHERRVRGDARGCGSCNSRSKPFMTESTTISTATPTASPSTDTTEMNDRKPRPRVERR